MEASPRLGFPSQMTLVVTATEQLTSAVDISFISRDTAYEAKGGASIVTAHDKRRAAYGNVPTDYHKTEQFL